ncbi:MAG: hypothetical protein AN490_04000 [Anabaena sp. AL09]|nr:MAG: hypothetical protein AN490_04000 [Anabaena sp. AL09]
MFSLTHLIHWNQISSQNRLYDSLDIILTNTYNICMQVEWNPEKAKSNLQKHGVSFSDAEAVLFDPYALSFEDQSAQGEQRFIIMGMDHLWRLLVVVYTYRGDNIRLISARPATPKEREHK